MRPLVQEPRKTRSMRISRIGVPASRSMYSSARRIASRWVSVVMLCGSGTRSFTVTLCDGLVPHVT